MGGMRLENEYASCASNELPFVKAKHISPIKIRWLKGAVVTARYKDTKTSTAANFRLHDDVALEVPYRSVRLRQPKAANRTFCYKKRIKDPLDLSRRNRESVIGQFD